MSLAAAAPAVREQGAAVLAAYAHRLEEATFRERQQVAVALHVLRNALDAPGARVNTCALLFCCRAVHLALHPDAAPMYSVVNKVRPRNNGGSLDSPPHTMLVFVCFP